MRQLLLIAVAISICISSVHSQVKKKVDEFTGDIILTTASAGYRAALVRFIKSKDTTTYLSLNTCGSSISVDKKGVIVLFTDSTKLILDDEEVDVKAGGMHCDYVYSAFCSLNQQELTSICTKTIKAFRLYLYDYHMKEGEAEVFQDDANKLVKAQ